MASLTVTIPDPAVPRVRDAFGKSLGTKDGNGAPRAATTEEVRQAIVRFLEDTTKRVERRSALEATMEAISDVGAS